MDGNTSPLGAVPHPESITDGRPGNVTLVPGSPEWAATGEGRATVQRLDGTWVTRAEDVPYGYCHCGCGNATKIADRTHTSKGHFKGEPYKFLMGHGGLRGRVSPPLESLFFHRVAKGASDDCWEWQGSKTWSGYGQFQHGTATKLAHRIAYTFANGDIPDGLVVRHKCDNPPCCNPAHLEVGTYKDNMQDAVVRDRMSHGEAHPFAVLTEDDVREIRAQHEQGVTISAMSRHYGVGRKAIRSAIRRETWRRVA